MSSHFSSVTGKPKRAFKSMKRALLYAKSLQFETADASKVNTYYCYKCGYYHIGREGKNKGNDLRAADHDTKEES